MNDIEINLQNEIFNKYYKLFYLITFGCGGVIFRQHFIKFLGKSISSCNEIIKKMEEVKLIRHYKLGRNTILIVKYATLCKFDLENKSIKLTSARLLHSALFCEMLLHTYNSEDIDKIDKLLKSSNFSYFIPRNSYRILSRIYSYLTYKGCENLNSLEWAMLQLDKKTTFIETCWKGRCENIQQDIVEIDDLLTLRNNDVYVKSVSSDGNTIKLNMVLFATNKSSDKIARTIRKTEIALNDMFSDINIKYIFDIYSLTEKFENIEKRVLKNLANENELKEEYYKEIITYHWYDCKNKLFSAIDLDKWL